MRCRGEPAALTPECRGQSPHPPSTGRRSGRPRDGKATRTGAIQSDQRRSIPPRWPQSVPRRQPRKAGVSLAPAARATPQRVIRDRSDQAANGEAETRTILGQQSTRPKGVISPSVCDSAVLLAVELTRRGDGNFALLSSGCGSTPSQISAFMRAPRAVNRPYRLSVFP